MSIINILLIIVALICCSAGSVWLLWDMHQQFKEYNKIMHKKDKNNK